MKKMLLIMPFLLVVSGLLFLSCSKESGTPKTEGTAGKSMTSEKASGTMDKAKEMLGSASEKTGDTWNKTKDMATGYTDKAGETMQSAKETVSGYGEKAKETMTNYTDKAKEQVYGYTPPEKIPAVPAAPSPMEGDQAADMMEKTESSSTLGDIEQKTKDALGTWGK